MPQTQLSSHRAYFRIEGDAGRPALALLHPIGSDHSLWDSVTALLIPRFQVLRPDLRGHGGSEAPSGEYSLDGLTDDFCELSERLGLSEIHLCGLSIGGMVAASVAARVPKLVRTLTLCSTAPRLPPPPGGWDGRAQAALAGGMAPVADGMMQRMIGPKFAASAVPALGTLRSVVALSDPVGYAGACAVLRDVDLAPVLDRVQAPTLVVYGESDGLMPPGSAHVMSSRLRRSRLVHLRCGHFPPLELPEAFARELSAWAMGDASGG